MKRRCGFSALIAALVVVVLLVPQAPSIHAQETTAYISCDGTVQFAYPADWFVLEDGQYSGIAIGNVAETVERTWVSEVGDGVLMSLEFLAVDDSFFSEEGLDSMEAIMDWVVADWSGDDIVQQGPEYYESNGRPAARVRFTEEPYMDVLLILVLDGDWYLGITVESIPGEDELTDNEAAILAIVDTMMIGESTVAEGYALYSEDNCSFTATYPDGWIPQSDGVGVRLYDSEDTYDQIDWDGGPPIDEMGTMTVLSPAGIERAFNFEGLDFEADPDIILVGYIEYWGEAKPMAANDVMVGGFNGIRVDYERASFSGDLISGFILLVDLGDDAYAIVHLETAGGNLAMHEDTALALAESIAYSSE